MDVWDGDMMDGPRPKQRIKKKHSLTKPKSETSQVLQPFDSEVSFERWCFCPYFICDAEIIAQSFSTMKRRVGIFPLNSNIFHIKVTECPKHKYHLMMVSFPGSHFTRLYLCPDTCEKRRELLYQDDVELLPSSFLGKYPVR